MGGSNFSFGCGSGGMSFEHVAFACFVYRFVEVFEACAPGASVGISFERWALEWSLEEDHPLSAACSPAVEATELEALGCFEGCTKKAVAVDPACVASGTSFEPVIFMRF